MSDLQQALDKLRGKINSADHTELPDLRRLETLLMKLERLEDEAPAKDLRIANLEQVLSDVLIAAESFCKNTNRTDFLNGASIVNARNALSK